MKQGLFWALAAVLLSACGQRDATETQQATSIEAASAAATPSFVGDWSGDLETPAGVELPLVLHISQETEGGGYAVTLDSPSQGAFGIEGENARVEDGAFKASFQSIGAEVALEPDDENLSGNFVQGLAMPLILQRSEAGDAVVPKRPQEDVMARDYVIETVLLPGGAEGVTLAGEFTRPHGDGVFPALVLISGSGPQDRNEELLDHKPFLVLSDYLTRSGYAVLRYDDRGVGESSGDFEAATSADFAEDAAAALAWLRDRADVDGSRSGYLGHSEGGLIAPLAAADERPDFMVLLAGPTQPLGDVIVLQGREIGAASGVPEAVLDLQTAQLTRVLEILDEASPDAREARLRAYLASQDLPDAQVEAQTKQFASPWMNWVADYDPVPALAEYDGPVLALYGEKDLQVSAAANAPAMEGALTHGGSRTETLAGLNHLFQPAETGAPAEYFNIEVTFDEGAMKLIVEWLDGLNG